MQISRSAELSEKLTKTEDILKRTGAALMAYETMHAEEVAKYRTRIAELEVRPACRTRPRPAHLSPHVPRASSPRS